MSDAPARGSRFHGRIARDGRCDAPGCEAAGEFRAPVSNRVPGEVGGWQWLCLDHVRNFNAAYNFFDGLSPDEIAEAQSPLAGWAHVAGGANGYKFNDPLNMMDGRFGPAPAASPRRTPTGEVLSDRDVAALTTLGLDASASRADIRSAHRRLARAYHPDTNGGDRGAERKLQDVVQAYTHLISLPAYARRSREP